MVASWVPSPEPTLMLVLVVAAVGVFRFRFLSGGNDCDLVCCGFFHFRSLAVLDVFDHLWLSSLMFLSVSLVYRYNCLVEMS